MLYSNPSGLAAARMYAQKLLARPSNVRGPESLRRVSFQAAAPDVLETPELTSLRDQVAFSRRRLQNNEEAAIRANRAYENARSEAEAIYNLDWTEFPEVDMPSVIDERANTEGRERYSIEEAFVGAVHDFAASSEDFSGRELDQIRYDRSINEQYMANRMDELVQTREQRNMLWGAFEILGLQSIPFYTSTREAGPERDIVSGTFAGSALRERAREFNEMRDSPPEVFTQYFDNLIEDLREQSTSFGYLDQSMLEHLATSITGDAPTAGQTNVFNALDNMPVVGAAANTGRRAITTPIAAVSRAGSRRGAAELARAALSTARTEGLEEGLQAAGLETKEDLLSAVSARALNPHGLTSEVSLSEDMGPLIDEVQELLSDLPRTERLSPSEREVAARAAQTRLEARFGSRPVRDVAIETEELADGTVTRRVSAFVGRQDGEGFASSAAAERYANSVGVVGDAVEDDSGRWFVRAGLDISETGAYTRPLDQKVSTAISRFTLGAREVKDDDLLNQAIVGANRRTQIIKKIIEPYQNRISRLPGIERETLQTIWDIGNQDARWFSRTEFDAVYGRLTDGVRPSNRAWEAYQDTIRMNDMEHVLRNDALYKDKVIRGYETVSFDGAGLSVDRMNGQVLESVPANEGILDLRSGQYFKPGTAPDLPDNFRVVRLERPEVSESGHTVRTVIAPVNQFRLEPLRRDQLAYRAGGHRMYQGDRFVKQARRGTQPDGGSFYSSPRTFLVGRTDAEVAGWARTMNEARELVRAADNFDDPDLVARLDEEVFKNNAGLPTGSEFVRLVRDGKIDLDEAFEVVGDRELPSAYNRLTPQESGMVDVDESGYESWLGTQNQMYYGSRGEALPDWTGRKAPVLDVYQMMNRSMRNIANLSSMTDYKNEALQRWAQTFGKYTDIREGASPAEVFVNGRLNTTDERLRQSAEATRENIRNILGWRTDEMRWVDALQRRLIDKLAGDVPGTNRAEFAAEASQWWKTQNPQAALTGVAFDLKLGLFNVAQFPLQISHMAAISALSPKHGSQAWLNHIPAYTYFMNGGEGILDTLTSSGFHKSVGFDDPEEYKSFMRYLRSGGYTDVSGNQILINEYGTSAVSGGFGGRLKQAREAARFFFYNAETWNRIMAQQVAWRETREQFPKLAAGSPEFIRKVAGRADDYTFNMIRETSAYWQRGALAVPTQFWSYSARMMEALLGKKFSTAAKMRLFLSQSALYGSSGVVGFNALTWMAGQINPDRTPDAPTEQSIETFTGLIDRGLLDYINYSLTGADVKIGERIGVGGFSAQLLRDLAGDGEFGETSVLDFIGGASMSIWYDTFSDGGQFLKGVHTYFLAEGGAEDVPFDNNHFHQLASNISSYSNARKAYMIHRHNILVSGSGTVIADNVPSTDAWAALLSYQPAETEYLSDLFDYMENRDQQVADLSRDFTRLRTMMVNDPDKAGDYAAQAYLIRRLHDPVIAQEAWDRSFSNWDPSLLDSIDRRVDQLRVRDMARDVEVNDGSTN